MAKARVFQRKDRAGRWVSYINAEGSRRTEKGTASPRTLLRINMSNEKARTLGIRVSSDISLADLRQRKHHAAR